MIFFLVLACALFSGTLGQSCGPNAYRPFYYWCQPACEPTCFDPNPYCPYDCVYRQCACFPGYLRNSNGICVTPEECQEQQNSCSTMNCGSNQICIMSQCFYPGCVSFPRCVPWWYGFLPSFFQDQPQKMEMTTEAP